MPHDSRCWLLAHVPILLLAAWLAAFVTSPAPQSPSPCEVFVGCPSQLSSGGCSPRIDYQGCPSASADKGFAVIARRVPNQTVGFLLYDVTGVASPSFFHGGVLCVRPPIFRAPSLASNGNALPAKDCSGGMRIDMNTFAAGLAGGDPLPALSVPGTEVGCQWWIRDAGDPWGGILTNALRYRVVP